jgi:hypothetical protein
MGYVILENVIMDIIMIIGYKIVDRVVLLIVWAVICIVIVVIQFAHTVTLTTHL